MLSCRKIFPCSSCASACVIWYSSSLPSSLASRLMLVSTLNRKCGLICDCRYLICSCAARSWFSAIWPISEWIFPVITLKTAAISSYSATPVGSICTSSSPLPNSRILSVIACTGFVLFHTATDTAAAASGTSTTIRHTSSRSSGATVEYTCRCGTAAIVRRWKLRLPGISRYCVPSSEKDCSPPSSVRNRSRLSSGSVQLYWIESPASAPSSTQNAPS